MRKSNSDKQRQFIKLNDITQINSNIELTEAYQFVWGADRFIGLYKPKTKGWFGITRTYDAMVFREEDGELKAFFFNKKASNERITSGSSMGFIAHELQNSATFLVDDINLINQYNKLTIK